MRKHKKSCTKCTTYADTIEYKYNFAHCSLKHCPPLNK